MFEFIRANQMDIMLALCATSAIMAVMLFITRFLPNRRKWVLINMEITATLLLFFDRLAYIYSGNLSRTAYIMVRVSNFMVFFLTAGVVFGFNLYLLDLLNPEKMIDYIPRRLLFVGIASVMEMVLVFVSQFTGLYYTFDENNVYHRGPGFLICYLVPVIAPIIQYTVIFENRKKFSKLINTALFLYIFVPIIMGVIQIFTYGISIVNMAMVMVSVSLYFFTYLDINDEVERVHKIEMKNLKNEKKSTQRLFDQTATAFVTAVEKKDNFSEGHSTLVANLAKRIAQKAGKTDDECNEVYYAALLHDIGKVGLPDSLIGKSDELTEEEAELLKTKPVLSGEILASITEYPYLSMAARYCSENYDGSGYPEGLKGKAIPETSRIIAVAHAYVSMASRTPYREPLPDPIIREEFIKDAGVKFDPDFADILVKIVDAEAGFKEKTSSWKIDEELTCGNYRDTVSKGIEISDIIKDVHFSYNEKKISKSGFSQFSIILFDSYDGIVHRKEKEINAFHYLEYGEIWSDGHYILTAGRNMDVNVNDKDPSKDENAGAVGKTDEYVVTSYRIEDHLKVTITGPQKTIEVVMALPDKSKSAFIGITGENCELKGIKVIERESDSDALHITRIADEIDYTERIASDIPNLQIDKTRSAHTEGILIDEYLQLKFHSLSLPSSEFIWNCPYIIIFTSNDRTVGGEGYHEYAVIKLNGENDGVKEFAQNKFIMEKRSTFEGWDSWKACNKQGIECEVVFRKRGNRVFMTTENLGIYMENTTIINDGNPNVYVALTGDQIALTDIRIKH